MSASQAAASCTLTPGGAITDVPVSQKLSVTYTFDTSASHSVTLQIPYAVEINGVVLPEFAKKPGCLGKDRKIKLKVAPGTKVALYLNSDAHPAYRTRPVYAVQARSRDVEVSITERLGRGNTETASFSAATCIQSADGKRFDKYDATLTGDIWMKVSHTYTPEEVAKLIPADTEPAIRTAVLQIYAPLTAPALTVNFPASPSSPSGTLSISFLEQENAHSNISYCPLLSHVLTRTHPKCYLALICEARSCGISKLTVNSAWRPLLGSIVHRAGLGLDVQYIESPAGKLKIDRIALTSKSQKSELNVTQAEKSLFKEYRRRQSEAEEKEQISIKLTKAASEARDNAALQREAQNADEDMRNARKAESAAKAAWNAERNTNEPNSIMTFRTQLSRRQDIKQVLDPWYIDLDTHDNTAASPNEQRSAVESMHNNHLHITVIEDKIL